MAFWNRDKAPAQKRSIIDVIKYDGPNDILVWKFPDEDFNTNTQLIVGPSQEAIFVKGGQVLERFISGTYTLSTKNYPFISSLVRMVTGGVTPFTCAVYYINKVVSMGIDWGTDTPISIVDPVYGVPVDVRSYGDFSLRVENGRKLMEKLVGQTMGFSHQEISQYFSNMMAAQVRSVISATMMQHNLSPIGIDAHLADMSETAKGKVCSIFEPYGLDVKHFTIAAITAPELDDIKQKARKLQEHRMETDVTTEDKRKMAQAQAFENRELNITEQDKIVGQMGQTLAGNVGPVTGAVGGIGLIGATGGYVQPATTGTADIARMLLKQDKGSVEEPKETEEAFEKRILRLKFMLDNGVISEDKYQEKINQIMEEI